MGWLYYLILIASAFVIFAYVHGNMNISEYLLIPYVEGSGEVAIFAASLVGAGLVFWFNSYPAEYLWVIADHYLGSSSDCLLLSLSKNLPLQL